jgi:hypothetical protein
LTFDYTALYNQDMETNKHGGKRIGAGRPSLPLEDRTSKRSVYLTDQEWNHCGRLVNLSGEGESAYIRRLVQEDMKKHQ